MVKAQINWKQIVKSVVRLLAVQNVLLWKEVLSVSNSVVARILKLIKINPSWKMEVSKSASIMHCNYTDAHNSVWNKLQLFHCFNLPISNFSFYTRQNMWTKNKASLRSFTCQSKPNWTYGKRFIQACTRQHARTRKHLFLCPKEERSQL